MSGGHKSRRSHHQQIRFEHMALNVSAPVEIARWYAANLDMRIVREDPPPINTRFIADRGNHMMLEVYTNPPDTVPDYALTDPLQLHLAFMVDNVDAIRARLIAAGATPVGNVTVTPTGDRLAMMRDPWGLAIQLVCRAEPMLSG
jgi:glyoxylase I family protein